jgi:hypothetical protein
MDEFTWMRLVGGMASGGIEWMAVLLFVAVAVLYFLAPVLGYRADRRGALGASLYLLVGYAGLALMQLFVQYLQVLDKPTPGLGRGSGESGVHILFAFAILKLLVFIIAMAMAAVGLQSLRFHTGGLHTGSFREE